MNVFRGLLESAFQSVCRSVCADPYSSVGSVQDLRTGDHWFDTWALSEDS